MPAPLRLFLSYRRHDSRTWATMLRHTLCQRMEGLEIFKDVDDIPYGRNFREVITREFERCDGVLALIGPAWDAARLGRANDFVRLELETAHRLGLPVIPVLVDEAEIPGPEVLPDGLEWLSFLNAARLRHDPDFEVDVDRLLKRGLQALVEAKAAASESKRRGETRRREVPRGPSDEGSPRRDGVETDWADDSGRDDFGLWAGVHLEGVSFRMRWIPPGIFWMGSPEDEEGRFRDEGPRHRIMLTKGLWLGEHPCTQDLWQAVTGERPSRFEGARRPVEKVSWDDVAAFLRSANAKRPALGLRLPSEAEWEYACRAGSEGPRHGPVGDVAWYADNSGGETHPVRERKPNAWGLYDMLGNVWEWCAEASASFDQPYGAVGHRRGPIRETGPLRGVRGGSWDDPAWRVRAAFRFALDREDRHDDLGFRVSRGPAGGARAGGP